ncbi:MAG: hypothetical protein NC548_35300 [Lachnospiraceae bacterium]|nr:hypothetical protein [Lachnospiraceae bacterium]
MKEIKYEIIRKIAEFGNSEKYDIVRGCTLNRGDSEVMEEFGCKQDAVMGLQKYYTKVVKIFEGGTKGNCYMATEYFALESRYENGKCVDSEVLGVSSFHVYILDEDSNQVIGSYDNYGDAIMQYYKYTIYSKEKKHVALLMTLS